MPNTSSASVTTELVTVNPYAYLEDRSNAASADMLLIAFAFAILGLGLLARASGIASVVRPIGSPFSGRAMDTPLWR